MQWVREGDGWEDMVPEHKRQRQLNNNQEFGPYNDILRSPEIDYRFVTSMFECDACIEILY